MSARLLIPLLAALSLSGCGPELSPPDEAADRLGFTAPTRHTKAVLDAARETLDLADPVDFEQATRGLIARAEPLRVTTDDGTVVWDSSRYTFMDGEAPDSVHPSLWRQAKLNNLHGLYQVTEGIYQVRGHDLSNMTLIEGASGWIVVDPLTSRETAASAIALANKHLGERPIRALIFTHSHIDHFGGAQAILTREQAASGEIPIVAPEGFMEEATSENIIAGVAMGRRAGFMYGRYLPRNERGHVGSGLGKSPAFGSMGILAPNTLISQTPQTLVLDGVDFVFQFAPESEAPAELTFAIPSRKAFCGAEVVSRNMHNLYTLRGAKVRDALGWSRYIDEMRSLYQDADVYFGSHHWPIWGQDAIQEFLIHQRDLYKYIHDQTVRLFNAGYTPLEIAEQLALPESLATAFYNRGYYGTVRHNARAVYQNYLGWYDANPANLNPLPPKDAGARYVELMGGADQVVGAAQRAFDDGEYRWTAELLNHVVFTQPNHETATQLLAKTYDQLGYQSESGPWRDVYLSAAYELRHGGPEKGLDLAKFAGVLEQTPVHRFFDSMAVRLDADAADGEVMTVNIHFTDIDEHYTLTLSNAVLHYRRTQTGEPADATLNLTHPLFVRMLTGQAGIRETLFSDALSVDGSAMDLVRFFALFDKPDGTFNVVTP